MVIEQQERVPENQARQKDVSTEGGKWMHLQIQDLKHILTFEMPTYVFKDTVRVNRKLKLSNAYIDLSHKHLPAFVPCQRHDH
jgi:hypothetical protein